MTKECKKYTPDNQPIEDFIDHEQAALMRYLETAYEQKKITETYYTFALGQHCDSDDWDGASEYFKAALTEFVEQYQDYEYYRLLERAENGEEYNAQFEPHDIRHIKGRKLLDEIYKQINEYQRTSKPNQSANGHRNQSA